MLLALTGVTVVSVALLAWVNGLTKEPIAQAKKQALDKALKEVLPDFDVIAPDTLFKADKNGKQAIDFIVYPATKAGRWVGTAVQSTSHNAFGGDLTILVGFDTEGTVLNYSLLQHAETPGLGSKADVWFKAGGKGDITGMNPGEASLAVSKDGGRVDAITASTITSRAFLQAVNSAYAAFIGQVKASGQADMPLGNDGATAGDKPVNASDNKGKESKL